MAHDVYTKLGEKWGQRIFSNIADSEQTHTESIKTLLDKYEISDPVKSDEIGDFTSVKMKKLYTDLLTQGEKSLEDALKVGATIEDLDIKDLQDLLDTNDNEDIKVVYENLMRGSRNHLRAYIRQLERNGASYSVKYISQEDYQEIISGEQEKGSMNNSDSQKNKINGQSSGQGGGSGNNGKNR